MAVPSLEERFWHFSLAAGSISPLLCWRFPLAAFLVPIDTSRGGSLHRLGEVIISRPCK
ncbi:hypothetical protein V8C26DRAFT_393391 [Trichoderma gracile]